MAPLCEVQMLQGVGTFNGTEETTGACLCWTPGGRINNNMKLRWYQTYDRFGDETEPALQYLAEYDEETNTEHWEYIDFVRERDDNYQEGE